MIWIAGAAAWGFAEATLFFIVPDVLLTWAVLKLGLKKALRLSAVAAAAAVAGGIVMWLWAVSDADTARRAMLAVPAIGPDLPARVAHRMAGFWWPLQLCIGAVTGVPYKLYAVAAGARGINPVVFAAVSFVARFARFALAAGITALARAGLERLGRAQWSTAVWAAGWLVLYAVYFTIRALA